MLALLREVTELTYNVAGNRIIIALRKILADYFVKLVNIRQAVDREGCFVYL